MILASGECDLVALRDIDDEKRSAILALLLKSAKDLLLNKTVAKHLATVAWRLPNKTRLDDCAEKTSALIRLLNMLNRPC